MKPYSPRTNKGRSVAIDDIHHKSSVFRYGDRSTASAKAMRHAARREGRLEAMMASQSAE